MTAGADPDLALREAKAVADLYGQAVDVLLRKVAARLARGIDEPGWAENKLLEVMDLRHDAQMVVDDLMAGTEQVVGDAVRAGWKAGAGQVATNESVVGALVSETVSSVTQIRGGILRATLDIFRTVVAESTGPTVAGATTRRQAAQASLDRFANRGIGGFVDKAGRRWSIDTYAEMATRTAVGRAQVAGGLQRITDEGGDLVIVSDAPQECKVCRRWEGKVLSVSGSTPTGTRLGGFTVAGTVAQAQAAGLHHPNCFPAEVLVAGPAPELGYRRWYDGHLVIIQTASGVELPVTPNHPVLTPEGWVTAGDLRIGQHVLRYGGDVEASMGKDPDDVQIPAPIGEVVGSFGEPVEMSTVSVPAAPEQFHGDGTIDGHVEVVGPNGLLGDDDVAGLCDHHRQLALLGGGMGLSPLLTCSPLGEVLIGADHASDGVVGSGDLPGPLVGGHAAPLPGLGLTSSDPGASDLDPATDGRLGDAEGGRELVLSLSGSISLDEIVHLSRREFSGHVYNLQTVPGWYTAGGIVVHNCRHRLGKFVPGLTQRMTDTADPEGDRLRQEQRRLERGVRQWKARAAAALDDDARRKAEGQVRAWQGRLRTHVADNDLKRLPYRERLGAR